MQGQVVKLITRLYYVRTEEGLFKCKTRGKLRLDGLEPLVGDEVDISPLTGGEAIIDGVGPRFNVLRRPRIANCRTLIIMLAPEPRPDFEFLDRLIIQAELNKARPVLCLNKVDMRGSDLLHEELKRRYLPNYNLIITSSEEKVGIEDLRAELDVGINVLCGQSGVGKSSLINVLLPESAMEVGGLSAKLGRGRHTTRHSELMDLGGGRYICDSPGFSSFENLSIDSSKLIEYMPDLYRYQGSCRFLNCRHIKEPDCSLRLAVEEGLVSEERYTSYVKFLRELETREKNMDHRRTRP